MKTLSCISNGAIWKPVATREPLCGAVPGLETTDCLMVLKFRCLNWIGSIRTSETGLSLPSLTCMENCSGSEGSKPFLIIQGEKEANLLRTYARVRENGIPTM